MTGERQLLRIGEYLVSLACRSLPPGIRRERYQEWAAELPAILHDPKTGPAPRRAVRMLAYAADTLRGTTVTVVRRRVSRETVPLYLFLIFCLVGVGLEVWAIVQAPGRGPNYLQLAMGLLVVACWISQLAGRAKRTSALLAIGVAMMAVAVNLWRAALAPGDWVNYFLAAFFFLLFLAVGVVTVRRARTRRA
jgi:hypothetical protein